MELFESVTPHLYFKRALPRINSMHYINIPSVIGDKGVTTVVCQGVHNDASVYITGRL